MKNIKRKSRAKKRKKLDEDLMEKFRTKLQAATFGSSPQSYSSPSTSPEMGYSMPRS